MACDRGQWRAILSEAPKGRMKMEIDITDFFKDVDTWEFSGSIATHGPDAGKRTWNAAKGQAAREPLLNTPEALDAMRQWAKETGAWSREEIAAWDDVELNALFIQLVTGEMREAGLEDQDFEDIDWEAYEARAQEGQISGAIFKGDDGRIYYYLGS
jgi:hypothetical protein